MSEDVAEQLLAKPYFELVADETEDDEDGDGDEDEQDEDDETAEAEADDEFDAEAFVDRTPVEDVAEDILAGEADGHLEEVAEADDRATTQDAVGERRAELEA